MLLFIYINKSEINSKKYILPKKIPIIINEIYHWKRIVLHNGIYKNIEKK